MSGRRISIWEAGAQCDTMGWWKISVGEAGAQCDTRGGRSLFNEVVCEFPFLEIKYREDNA